MTCIVSQKDFKNLKKGSGICNENRALWFVDIANCGGAGRYPTHLFKREDNSLCHVFHDGMHMRFLDENDTKTNGSICGDFEGKRISTEGVKLGLIISSDTAFFEQYKNVGDPVIDIFYAPSLETAYLLMEIHDFNFAIINDSMYGRIPGVEPESAIRRDNAGSVYGIPILEERKMPYIIISQNSDITLDNLNHCLYFGGAITEKMAESILIDKGVIHIY